MKIKKILVGAVLAASLCACENIKPIGNKMATGSYTYYYAYVRSQITGDKYYHINGWAEYGPEGGNHYEAYVGLELHLAESKDVVYYYEPNLMYILSKNYNPNFGPAIS